MSSIHNAWLSGSKTSWRERKQGASTRGDRLAMLENLAYWLDSAFRIPLFGTRIGLDAIIGLVPGIGDAITSIASLFILHAASRYGVPRVTLARMGLNVAIDFFFGSIPFVGDLFDAYWKSNIKNVELLKRYLYSTPDEHRRHRWGDRLFVAAVLLAVVAMAVASVWITYLIIVWIGHVLFGAPTR